MSTGLTATEVPSLRDALDNAHYRGRRFGWLFLLLMAGLNLFRGSVHTFRDDGGAQSIAGIDLSENREVILSLFATAGWTQLITAVVDLLVALRLRALAPHLVAFHLVQNIGALVIVWWWRPLPVPAPGKFVTVPMLLLSALAMRSASSPMSEPPPR